RTHLSKSAVPDGLSRLPAGSGVHYPLHAGAERDHRALLPQREGRMCLAAQLRQLRARPARAEGMDLLVQRGAPAPGTGLSEPPRIPGARSNSRGLIPREHYTPCIVVIDAAACRLVRTFPSPFAGPHGLDLDVPRRRLFCACDGGQLLAMSIEAGHVEKSAPLSGVPDVVFFNAELNHVYVAVGDPGVIDVFDALALHRIATVKTGPGAHTIGFDAARNFVYAFLPESHAAAVYRAA